MSRSLGRVNTRTASPAYSAQFLAQLAASGKKVTDPAVQAVVARLRKADNILGLSQEPAPETAPMDEAALRAQLSQLQLSMPPFTGQLQAGLKSKSFQPGKPIQVQDLREAIAELKAADKLLGLQN